MPPVQHLIVTQNEAGQKLLQYLQRRLASVTPAIPRSLIMRWIRKGEVRINKKRSKPFDRIEAGDTVRIPPFSAEEGHELTRAPQTPPESSAPANPVQAATAHATHDGISLHTAEYTTHNATNSTTERLTNVQQKAKEPIVKGCHATPDTTAAPLSGPDSALADRSPRELSPSQTDSPLQLSILAHEHDVLVLDKPAGLPVQPGSGHSDSIATRLKTQFATADFVPTPAHRLDKATSGLLLAATSYSMLRHLHELFRDEHAIKKTYLAWVHGVWPEDSPLQLRDSMEKRGTSGAEKMHTGKGKHAACTVHPVFRKKNATLLAVSLHTGRTHQIRVQLSSRGFPVVGDRKYGGPPCRQGMLLHAWRLEFPLPANSPDARVAYASTPRWSGPWRVSDSLADI